MSAVYCICVVKLYQFYLIKLKNYFKKKKAFEKLSILAFLHFKVKKAF